MAGELNIGTNETASILVQVFKDLVQLPGLSFIVTLSKAIGIAILVYIGFLIIKTLVQTRQAFRIKSIAVNVEQINKKLDSLIKDKKSKK